MDDRVSTYPGRVTLTPVAGQTNTYDLTMADEPTQEGTPPTKANLLTDATAAKLDGVATPNAAFDLMGQFIHGFANYYVWAKQQTTYTFELGAQTYSVGFSPGETVY